MNRREDGAHFRWGPRVNSKKQSDSSRNTQIATKTNEDIGLMQTKSSFCGVLNIWRGMVRWNCDSPRTSVEGFALYAQSAGR